VLETDVPAPSVHMLDGDAVEAKLEGFGFRWFRPRPPDQTTTP
jgi:hypothetical protein